MTGEHTAAELIVRLHTVIAEGTYEHLKSAAPGIAEPARRAIANNLAIKLSRNLEAETAAERDRLRAEVEEFTASLGAEIERVQTLLVENALLETAVQAKSNQISELQTEAVQHCNDIDALTCEITRLAVDASIKQSGHIQTGRLWDALRRAGDRSRALKPTATEG